MAGDTQPSLGFLLHDTARLLRRNFNRRAQELGLTQAQWQVLAHVSRNEGIRQAQLADILEVQPISIARLIDRMEAAGWVERRPDPSDRRAVNLYLRAKAAPMLEKMRGFGAEVREQALAGISDEERGLLMQILARMRQNLAERLNELREESAGDEHG